jgi:hypothetical protein
VPIRVPPLLTEAITTEALSVVIVALFPSFRVTTGCVVNATPFFAPDATVESEIEATVDPGFTAVLVEEASPKPFAFLAEILKI